MKDAVSDGTVTPLLYEERKPILDVNERAIDNWFEKVTAGLSEEQRGDLKKKFGTKGAVYGSGDRINLIALDIATHFKENFKDLDLGLKGQLATNSKRSAIRYKKALDATGLVSSAIVISPPDTREGHSEVDEAELPEVLQWWKENVKGDAEDYERQVIVRPRADPTSSLWSTSCSPNSMSRATLSSTSTRSSNSTILSRPLPA